MRASNFRWFKKSLVRLIDEFSIEADKNVGDDEWEMPIHRHCAAEILAWILNRSGATLRKSQLIEAWRFIVSKCWNLMDCNEYSEQNNLAILGQIQYFKEKLYRKNAEKILAENSKQNHFELQAVRGTHGVTRIRRVCVSA